jgi:hypothetical protein
MMTHFIDVIAAVAVGFTAAAAADVAYVVIAALFEIVWNPGGVCLYLNDTPPPKT